MEGLHIFYNPRCLASIATQLCALFVGPLQRVRPRNGILGLVLVLVVVVLPLRSEFIGEL